jgi:acyl-CoA synthetase (AMP-forming)/AMP-acid ligase II
MTTALQMTVLLGTIMVLGPADQPATAKIADQVLRYGNVTAAVLPPYLLEDLCRNPTTLKHVQRLKYIHYAGAPLSQDAGDAISRHTKLVSAMGSTEAGPYFVNIHDEIETAWNYHSFCPSIGLEMEYRTKDLYEPVFRKQKALARWQQIFHVYPELDTFYTKDLMRKHPTEPNLWVYAGRTDDLVILSLGECLYASSMESAVQNHPRVRSAIIGGEGRKKPFLILELMREDGQPGTGVSNPELLDQIWPAVQEANEQCSEPVRLSRELTMLAKADKPFRRTAKGTVARRDTLAFYKDEVDALYRSEDVAAVWSRTT